MNHKHTLFVYKIVLSFSIYGFLFSSAEAQTPNLEITATGSQEATQSILTPTKVLQGDELLNKLGTTLGATLAN